MGKRKNLKERKDALAVGQLAWEMQAKANSLLACL
jgi:hypothetical protein